MIIRKSDNIMIKKSGSYTEMHINGELCKRGDNHFIVAIKKCVSERGEESFSDDILVSALDVMIIIDYLLKDFLKKNLNKRNYATVYSAIKNFSPVMLRRDVARYGFIEDVIIYKVFGKEYCLEYKKYGIKFDLMKIKRVAKHIEIKYKYQKRRNE